MLNIYFLASAPGRFRDDLRICASVNYFRDALAEALPHLFTCFCSALILNSIVQQRRYCLIFVGSVFEDDTRDPKQVRDVWGLRAFTKLFGVKLCGEDESFFKAWCEHIKYSC